MDLTHYSVLKLVIFATVGISVSLACDGERIQQCAVHMVGVDIEASLNTRPSPQDCEAVSNTIRCYDRETSSCPKRARAMIDQARNILKKAEEACLDPDSDAGKELTGLAACDTQEFQKCAARMQHGTRQSAQERCSALEFGKKCLEDFKKDCASKFVVDMVDTQAELIQEQMEECTNRGYIVVDRTHAMTDMTDKEEKSTSGDADQNRSGTQTSDSGTKTKDNNLSSQNEQECPGGPKCGCQGLQSTYVTMVIVAMLAVLRNFL